MSTPYYNMQLSLARFECDCMASKAAKRRDEEKHFKKNLAK